MSELVIAVIVLGVLGVLVATPIAAFVAMNRTSELEKELALVRGRAFVIPDDRGPTFYSALIACAFAEVVWFAFLAYLLLAARTTDRPSPAVRIRLMYLISFWAVAIIVSSIIAARRTACSP